MSRSLAKMIIDNKRCVAIHSNNKIVSPIFHHWKELYDWLNENDIHVKVKHKKRNPMNVLIYIGNGYWENEAKIWIDYGVN